MKGHKVFGIGFHKTGTTSLGTALEILGYRVTGPNEVDNPRIAIEIERVIGTVVPAYDAFQDNPWPIVYRRVDELYPGSKFILTIRDTDAWLRSIVRHFSGQSTPMREWIYGVGDPRGNEDRYAARYDAHNREVVEYFSSRPTDLLVLRLTDGERWEKLCDFLNLPLPDVPFPHENRAEEREARQRHTERTRSRRNPKWKRALKRLFGPGSESGPDHSINT